MRHRLGGLGNHATSRDHVGRQVDEELRPERQVCQALDDNCRDEKHRGYDDATHEDRRVLVVIVLFATVTLAFERLLVIIGAGSAGDLLVLLFTLVVAA